MANYTAFARSNKFKVNSIEDFEAGMPAEIEVHIEDIEEKIVCLLCDEGWPSEIEGEDGEIEEWDIETYAAKFLVDGEWCVIQEVGAEKLRYLVGYSIAFNNKGERYCVSIDNVYKNLPPEVTPCSY